MILNRIELGTPCTIRKNGETGKVSKIFFYPTKYEVEFPNGHVDHYYSKDLEFDGIKQERVAAFFCLSQLFIYISNLFLSLFDFAWV